MDKPAAILFDWDNTLVDTFPVLHRAMNIVFTQMQRPLWTREEALKNIRYSMRDSFPEMFGDQWEKAAAIFYEAFEETHTETLSACKGAKALLLKISALNIPMGIISNKTGKYLRKEISHLGWEHFFRFHYGAGDLKYDKPNPVPVYKALEKIGLSAGRHIWFVGDSGVDMEIAHRAGLTAIVIQNTTLYCSNEFAAYPPHREYTDCSDFSRILEF